MCDYHGLVHAVQVLGRSSHSTQGKVVCVGAQGYATQKPWQEETSSTNGTGASTSSWQLNLQSVRSRVERLGVNTWSSDGKDGKA